MVYDRFGNSYSKGYTRKGIVIDYDKPNYTTYQDAISYAYGLIDVPSNDVISVLTTDQHNYVRNNRLMMFPYIKDIVNWNRSYFMDLGDKANVIGYEDIQNHNQPYLEYFKDAHNGIPQNRIMELLGNHDVWGKDAENKSYGLVPSDRTWLMDKYYPNTGAAHYYDNDFVQDVGAVKFVSIGAWDFDSSLGGYSHYNINGQHMDSIIQMLSTDGDIVILSHVHPFKKRAYRYTLAVVDGEMVTTDIGANTSASGNIVYDTYLDDLIKARNEHTSGSVKDSYKVDHAFDFTNCTGNILCCLHGHDHEDGYGYAENGILYVEFDCLYLQDRPFFMFGLDKTNGCINICRITDAPQVVSYSLQFRRQQ